MEHKKFKDYIEKDFNINDFLSKEEINKADTSIDRVLNNISSLFGEGSPLVETLQKLGNLLEKYPELKDIETLFEDHPEYEKLDIDELLNTLIIHTPRENITTLKSIVPINYVIPINKLSKEIVKDFVGFGDIPLSVGGGKKEVLTVVSLNYDSEGIQIYNKSERFTPYDRVVVNSVCSLYLANNIYITPQMVYRCMNGLTDNEKVSPQAVGAVTKSIDKVSSMKCVINCTAEVKSRGYEMAILEGHILATKKLTLSTGKTITEGYKILDEPILYTYANKTKQLITIPIQLLQTKSAINSTDDVVIIKEYLITRIEIMKRNKNQSNKILYETIYKEIGQVEPTKEKSKKVRDAVKKLLIHWKSKNYITDFLEYKEGKSFKGIDIFY